MYELLSADQMQQADRLAVQAGADSLDLMRAAALAVADVVTAVSDAGARIVALAAAGNNGGDAAMAAALLSARGFDVALARASANPSRKDAATAFAEWRGETLTFDARQEAAPADSLTDALQSADCVIDGLFGAGLSGAVSGYMAALIDLVNASPAHVVSVDLPSGVDGNRNRADGAVIRADHTVTFFRLKPVHVLQPGRSLCGQVHLAQIGIDASVLSQLGVKCRLNHPAHWQAQLPVPGADGHKYDRGHVLVRGGAAHASGAARLAADTALCAGAGLVSVTCDRDAVAVYAAHLTAVMIRPLDVQTNFGDTLSDTRFRCVVLGPGNGVGAVTRQAVLLALNGSRDVVLDADALTSFSEHRDSLYAALHAHRGQAVLTPHAGEFARLFPDIDSGDKLQASREAAHRANAVLVYKGSDTLIAAPDGRATINASAPPWLATAGAGDVLAGLIAALTVQGMDAYEAACAAVWMHGEAALRLGYPITAEQLPAAIALVVGEQTPIVPPPAPMGLPG